MKLFTLPSAVLLLSGLLGAQKTWILDATGNGDFRDFPTAISWVAPGDTLAIRPGTYDASSGGALDKPLHLRGAPSATLLGLSIVEIPRARSVTISDLRLDGTASPGRPGLLVENSVGWVSLERCSVQACRVRSSHLVTMNECTLTSHSYDTVFGAVVQEPLHASGSSVLVLSNSSFTASAGPMTHSALSLDGGLATLSGCTATGSPSFRIPNLPVPVQAAPAPGIVANRAHLWIEDASVGRVAAGSAGSWTGRGVPAILFQDGQLRIDPAVQLQSTLTPVQIEGRDPIVRSLPGVAAKGTTPGGTVPISQYGKPGDTAVLFFGVPNPNLYPAFGPETFWYGPLFLLHVGLVPASGRLDVGFPIPQTGVPNGLSIVLQSFHLSNTDLRITPPAMVLVN